ncbi:hypothetical protein [Paracoccus sp. KR1-242]|uniref:hypothetical protein n=1 Tax=Paracoccus sp. KR1-242 TaxID=3410028 RepID=UPI003C0BA283
MSSAALHELRHALAASVACQLLGVRTAGLEVHIEAGADGSGEFAVIPLDLSRHDFEQIMALAACGPLIGHPNAERAILSAQSLAHPMLDSVYARAGLSDADFLLIERWQGPFTTVALVVAAVRAMEDDLGIGGKAKLCGVIRKLGAARIDRNLTLDELAPPARARKALARAKQVALA